MAPECKERRHMFIMAGVGLGRGSHMWAGPCLICLSLVSTEGGGCCSFSTLCAPMDCSMPGFPVLHHIPEFAQTHESVMPSNHLIDCHLLLLLTSIFPSIRVFSNESTLLIRWPKVLELQLQHQSFQ